MWSKPFDGPAVGAIVPVRYDPSDRSKVEVDMASMNRRTAGERSILRDVADAGQNTGAA